MKTLSLQQFQRLKFKAPFVAKTAKQVKNTSEGQDALSATQARVQAYCECPLHPLK